jgi:hypothetical protein
MGRWFPLRPPFTLLLYFFSMYGLVNNAIEELVISNYGEEKWLSIKQKAGVDVEVFISNEGYSDEITYKLVAAASEVLGISVREVLIAFGEHWVLKTALHGYGVMMRSGGTSLKEFLINLPNLHTRVQMIYPNLQPPRFECHDVTDSSMSLHYHTHRPGLTDFVVGLVQGLGKLYKTPAKAEAVALKTEGADHDIFAINWSTPEA